MQTHCVSHNNIDTSDGRNKHNMCASYCLFVQCFTLQVAIVQSVFPLPPLKHKHLLAIGCVYAANAPFMQHSFRGSNCQHQRCLHSTYREKIGPPISSLPTCLTRLPSQLEWEEGLRTHKTSSLHARTFSCTRILYHRIPILQVFIVSVFRTLCSIGRTIEIDLEYVGYILKHITKSISI